MGNFISIDSKPLSVKEVRDLLHSKDHNNKEKLNTQFSSNEKNNSPEKQEEQRENTTYHSDSNNLDNNNRKDSGNQFLSNLKIWKAETNNNENNGNSVCVVPFSPSSADMISSEGCYLVLHSYYSQISSNVELNLTRNVVDVESESISILASRIEENIVPEDIQSNFTCSFESNGTPGLKIVTDENKNNRESFNSKPTHRNLSCSYEMYVWRGKNCLPMLKSQLLNIALSLDRNLQNGKVERILNAGKPIPIDTVYLNDVMTLEEYKNSTPNSSLNTRRFSRLYDKLHLFRKLVTESNSVRQIRFNAQYEEPDNPAEQENMVEEDTEYQAGPVDPDDDDDDGDDGNGNIDAEDSFEGKPPSPLSGNSSSSFSLNSEILNLTFGGREDSLDLESEFSLEENEGEEKEDSVKNHKTHRHPFIKVRQNIYMGDANDAENLENLKSYGITHVLSINRDLNMEQFSTRNNNFTLETITMPEFISNDIHLVFVCVVGFLDLAIENRGKILVIDDKEKSLSVTAIIGYIMWKEDVPIETISRQFSSAYSCYTANTTQTAHLMQWQTRKYFLPQFHYFVFTSYSHDSSSFTTPSSLERTTTRPTNSLSIALPIPTNKPQFRSHEVIMNVTDDKRIILWKGNDIRSFDSHKNDGILTQASRWAQYFQHCFQLKESIEMRPQNTSNTTDSSFESLNSTESNSGETDIQNNIKSSQVVTQQFESMNHHHSSRSTSDHSSVSKQQENTDKPIRPDTENSTESKIPSSSSSFIKSSSSKKLEFLSSEGTFIVHVQNQPKQLYLWIGSRHRVPPRFTHDPATYYTYRVQEYCRRKGIDASQVTVDVVREDNEPIGFWQALPW